MSILKPNQRGGLGQRTGRDPAEDNLSNVIDFDIIEHDGATDYYVRHRSGHWAMVPQEIYNSAWDAYRIAQRARAAAL